MAADEPPYLTVGTDVSAKYKGAFCEAKIKKVNRVVKCKITFKNNMGSFMITDDQLKGPLRIGADIEAKHPEKNQFFEAVINKLQDYSQYTVVFDDGDETTLRRTSLCLKSGRHFAESPTLDQFPLTNPEHFGTPVIGSGKYKRKRRSTMNSSLDYESSDDDAIPRKLKAIRGKERDPDLGKVVCVDYGDRRKKDSWYPGLIVPHPAQSSIKISKEEHLIRSFKDGKYYRVPKRDTREFVKESIQKVENNSLRTAIEKAVLYLEKEELPPHWDKALFMGLDSASADEDSRDSDSDSSDDEPSEEKDRFVAQLYKFMDERGTPINKAPTVSSKDLNLYKLFKIMHKLGGYNKVTNKNKWKAVYLKMGLPSANMNGPNQMKFAYKRYLQSFEDFYRKLGCTMVNNSRSTRGRHRSDRNFIITRTRDRDTASPKGRNSKDSKDKPSNEKKLDDKTRTEKKDPKTDENSKSDDKSKSPEKKKVDRLRSEDKDEKKKKEEKPRLVRSQSLNKDKKENSQKEEDKKDPKPEKARTREDARKEKNESPEKKGTRSTSKLELERKEREEALKDKKEKSPKEKEKKEEKPPKEVKDEKGKDKKEDKPAIKDRKPTKEKKVEEKVVKEKRENPVREKREVALGKDKRDSSKEPKEDKVVKGKKEKEDKDNKTQPDDKPPLKKKLERLAKEKKEEKVIRSRRDDKSPSSEVKKLADESDLKVLKEEKQLKIDVEVKKEDVTVREKPKLRERREDTPFSEEGDGPVECDVGDDKEVLSLESLDKRGPGSRLRGDDNSEPPNKGKRRSLKGDDKDEKESLIGLSDSDDESFTNDSEKLYNKDMKHSEIEIGDRVKVKYGRGRVQKVYEAKVLRIEADGQDKRFFVHYAGWNMRYDEWVRKSFIVANLSSKQKQESSSKQNQPSSTTVKKVDKGRPPGVPANAKPVRKNSTSSTNSSLSCSRATRSDKKSLNSPLSSGLEPRKRTRRKSGVTVGLADTSQESESDGEDQDLEDEVDEADVEDNTTNQLDCCFKEELFSDDEEKEKLEDVKRGDITELEKAISVEESADDIKSSFFGPLPERNSFEEKVMKEESIEVIEPSIMKDKECPPPDIKNEKQKCESNEKVEKSGDTLEKELKSVVTNASSENKSSVDIPVTPAVIKKFSDIIKPGKIVFPVSSSPELKTEKAPFTPTGITPLPCNLTPPKKTDFTPKSNYIPSAPSLTENKSALSFAGLQGLIQKSAFEKNVTPEKILPKDVSCKPIFDTAGPSSPPKIIPRADLEPKVSESKTSPELKPEKVMPVFEPSNILSSSRASEPVLKCEDTSNSKIPGSIFSCIIKPETEKQLCKDSKHVESGGKVLAHDLHKDKKLDNEKDASHILKSPDSIGSSSDSPTFKHSLISPAKFCSMSTENVEKKPKDNFDLLMQNSQDNAKFPDIKDNIFSLSFSHTPPKDKFTLDQPYNKLLALSENLCRIKPKPSETVDLSKTIPGILERLKKDVVADLKITDSPPPQKEELNFDFLKSSQDSIKCLSRSDSSNSLRICEDMSDTNDSNLDSKDLIIISEKCNSSGVLPSLTENFLPSVKENTSSKSSELVPTLISLADESSAAEKEEGLKNSQKTSVITVATPPSSASIISVSTEKSTDAIKTIPDSNINSKNELNVLKAVDLPTSKTDSNLNNNELSSATDLSVPDSDETDKNNDISAVKTSNNEVSDVPLKTESKDSLFDDLLKIKNSSANFSSNSVIKHTPEPVKGSISTSSAEIPVAVEKEESNVKEECLVASKPESETLSQKDNIPPKIVDIPVVKDFEEDKSDTFNSNILSESKLSIEDNLNPEEDGSSIVSKREGKKKKLGKKLAKKFSSEGFDNEKDFKTKEGKSKSKKRAKMEGEDGERSKDSDFKSKSKKIKKNKNKKRFAKHEDQMGEHSKKLEFKEDDHKDMFLDKVKRKEKRKSDKKFLKCSLKSDDYPDTKSEMPKKKKGKKNRDKLGSEKKDFSEKKTKKKRKLHLEDTQDTDSEKDSAPKVMDKKKKKDRKKFKVKDCSSSDDAVDKCFKEQSKEYLPSSSETLLRQDSKSDDPDMSFLLCEEKVPASPVGNLADDTSGSSSIEGNRVSAEMEGLPLPNSYPCIDNIESDTLNKHSIDTSAVLDNTPPTTPSSTESLLSSSPSHERDSFSLNYPESTQSGRDSGEGESDLYRCNPNRTVVRGSEEYHAAATLAFAVCKSVSEKPKDDISHNFMKRQKVEVDDHSPSKRKKKSKRIRRSSESAKSPRHKSSLPRMSKIESCCEDSSGASPATSNSPPYGSSSTLSFTRCSPHRLSCVSDGLSRYNFYVPLHDKDPEKRIAALQEKMTELRKAYMALRAEVIAIDHKRRRARKKVRDAAGAASTNPSVQSEEGQNFS